MRSSGRKSENGAVSRAAESHLLYERDLYGHRVRAVRL